jgi:anti-sigma B factor antagonist
MMEITDETRGEWRVVMVRGRADAITCDQLQARLCGLVEKSRQVAVDFSGLDYISSCGLRALLAAARDAQGRKVRFAICAASAPVKKVFDISGLEQILEIRGDLPC